MKKYLQYVNEYMGIDFPVLSVGDKVELTGSVSGKDVSGIISTISDIIYDAFLNRIEVNGEIVDLNGKAYRGVAYYIEEIDWYVSPYNIKNFKKKKIKRIENPDVDPFGEEDWGYETLED